MQCSLKSITYIIFQIHNNCPNIVTCSMSENPDIHRAKRAWLLIKYMLVSVKVDHIQHFTATGKV